jgi:hypothetical protein
VPEIRQRLIPATGFRTAPDRSTSGTVLVYSGELSINVSGKSRERTGIILRNELGGAQQFFHTFQQWRQAIGLG